MSKRHGGRIANLESLFIRLEELVLANSGEDEFEEIFKLVIAKLWDEECGKQARFRRHKTDAETQRAIGNLLKEAVTEWPGVLESTQPRMTAAQVAVCVDALAGYRIADDGFEVIDGLFEFLVARDAKGAKGQYFTPRFVTEFCVRMLEPRANETVLDPACGSGGFLVHALNHVAAKSDLHRAGIRKFCESKLFGVDVDPRAVRLARALIVIAGHAKANLFRLNSLQRIAAADPRATRGTASRIEDAIGITRVREGFDIILTNPPFAGDVRDRALLDSYDLARGEENIERDILFIERCIDLLAPGGRMAIILPHNKLAAASVAYVRRWMSERVRILGVVGLGRHTFLPHTHQKAGILFVQRTVRSKGDYNIFFAVSQKDGKNSKGQPILKTPDAADAWTRVDHDLGEIVDAFKLFCRQEDIVMGKAN